MFRNRHRLFPAFKVLYLAACIGVAGFLSGCGLVADGVDGLRAVQMPPGKLYSPEFYRTATLEEVKEAIGNRSLADEKYTERHYSANTEGRGFLAEIEGWY